MKATMVPRSAVRMTIEPLVQDVRLAWRGLRRTRGFTAAAVLTLAVGMAGVTSMYAVIQGVLLRPLPMPDPEQLVSVWKELRTGSTHWPFRAAELALIRDGNRVLRQRRCHRLQRSLSD